MNLLLENFSVDKECEVNKILYKKYFLENSKLNSDDKKLFNSVNKITWLYSIREEFSGIEVYSDNERKYEEVEFILLELKEELKRNKRLIEILNSSIPYPLVVLTMYKEKMSISVAHKITNNKDESKNVVENILITDWIDMENLLDKNMNFLKFLNYKNLPKTDFFSFYNEIYEIVFAYNAINEILGLEGLDIKVLRCNKTLLNEIVEVDKEINFLKKKIKKEKNFNDKLELNINIKDKEEEKYKLIKNL